MKTNKFLFVNSTGSAPEDVKERERVRTQARSHAALASHAVSRHQHEAQVANGTTKGYGKENSPPHETSPRSSTTSSPGESKFIGNSCGLSTYALTYVS